MKNCAVCLRKHQREANRRAYAKNPRKHYEQQKLSLQRDSSRLERRKEYARDYQLRRLYGLGFDDVKKKLRAQNGCCALCATSEPGEGRFWAVDHDHETGTIRDILCHACNKGIGNFNDDPALCEAAAAYLRKHGR